MCKSLLFLYFIRRQQKSSWEWEEVFKHSSYNIPNFIVVHGGLSQWTTWSLCDKQCGGGWTRRHRACDNPAPENGGRFCIGSFVENLECNVHFCAGK